MKLICILFFFVAIGSSLEVASIQDKVKEIIQQFKDAIPEPISFPNATITIPKNSVISGDVDLSNVVVSGLKAMEVSVDFYFASIPNGFSFKLKDLQLHTGYHMKIPIFNLPILTLFGNGNQSLSMNDLSINGSIDALKLPNIFRNVKTSVGEAKFSITGLLDDSIVSKQLSDNLSEIIMLAVNNEESGKLLEIIMNAAVEMIINHNKTEQIKYMRHGLFTSPTKEEADYFILPNAVGIFIDNLLQLYENEMPNEILL